MNTFSKKFVLSVILFFVVTLSKEIPFINILVVDKFWLLYIPIFVVLLIPLQLSFYSKIAPVLVVLALLSSYFHFKAIAEIIGILLYLIFWGIALNKFVALLKSEKNKV